MTKRLLSIVIPAFVIGILISGIAYAQCPQMEKGQGMTKKSEMMPSFTPAQEKEMMTLHMNLIKETSPIKAELKIKEIELQMLWQEDNLDAEKILAKVKEISNLKASLEEKMVNQKLSMHKILTPEQKKMMKGMMGMGCCGMGDEGGKMGGGMGMGGSCQMGCSQ